MAFYYKFAYIGDPELTEQFKKNLEQEEKKLLLKDSFCFFTPDRLESIYFSCANDELAELLFTVDLGEKGVIPIKIEKEEYRQGVTAPGKITGSNKWFYSGKR